MSSLRISGPKGEVGYSTSEKMSPVGSDGDDHVGLDAVCSEGDGAWVACLVAVERRWAAEHSTEGAAAGAGGRSSRVEYEWGATAVGRVGSPFVLGDMASWCVHSDRDDGVLRDAELGCGDVEPFWAGNHVDFGSLGISEDGLHGKTSAGKKDVTAVTAVPKTFSS